ncbi:PAS domain-containing protein [Thiorhodococcus minor]|uniref:PAS domain S-box protein n=1 Tax=Thiorhodococcus minor TaxID=57489 RepID=A0A6M0K4V2_9GAMM|nr:PAS domain-containing protein [Thiorhodococcus minor]NEV63405.1 PAS domain S-box protein [Thiorhodococcus minor]
MTKGLGESVLDDLRIECEALRHQLIEAHRALASASGRSDMVLGDAPADLPAHPRPSAEDTTYGRLVENILQGVALVSASGQVLHANQRLAQLIGIAPEQLPGSSLPDHLPAQVAKEMSTWLDTAAAEPVRASHRIPTRDGQVRHLHFSVNRVAPETNAARSLVVTDLDQVFDRQVTQTEEQVDATADQSIEHARSHALTLLRSALDAHARADAIQDELQREIRERERAQAALEEAERRHERIMETIGSTRWLSTADWETLLFLDGTQPTSRRVERQSPKTSFLPFGLNPKPGT